MSMPRRDGAMPRFRFFVRAVLIAARDGARPRRRFSVGGMMIAVAVLGVGLGLFLRLVRLDRVSREHLARTLEASSSTVSWEMKRLQWEYRLRDPSAKLTPEEGAAIRLEMAKASRERDYHEGLRAKYARAIPQPWLPVAPDPPGPK